MGIIPVWQQDVIANMKELGADTKNVESTCYNLISLRDGRTIINLISLANKYNPADLVLLQEQYQLQNIYLVHLWEDVWQTRKVQVMGRVSSIMGLNKRIHARKTKVISITQKEADNFLNNNHLQASAKSRYKFGLSLDGQLVAVACFSNLRFMKKIAPGYRSAELIRFASSVGYTVIGGFSKLLNHFIKNLQPDDIMSYADRDWSLGTAYEQSGFKLSGATLPSEIWLKKDTLVRYFPHRLPIKLQESSDQTKLAIIEDEYIQINNTGNLKYILYL